MTAQIRFDQVGLTAGVAGASRSDGLRNGARVTVTNVSGRPCRCEWWWRPPEETGAVLVQSGPGVWYFDPTPNMVGDYAVRMIEDEGLATESEDLKAFGVRYLYSGLLAPAMSTRGAPTINLSSTNDEKTAATAYMTHNEALPVSGVRFSGWWKFIRELFAKVEELCTPPAATTNSIVNPLVFDKNKLFFIESGGSGVLNLQLAGSGHSATATVVEIFIYIAPNSGYTSVTAAAEFSQDGNPFTAFDPTKGYQIFVTRFTNGSRITHAMTGKVVTS